MVTLHGAICTLSAGKVLQGEIMRYRLICTSPRILRGKQFQDLRWQGFLEHESRMLLDLPVVGIVLGPKLHWEATLFLLEKARTGNSVSGDTVRTYGESLVYYLNYLLINDAQVEDETERSLQIFRNFTGKVPNRDDARKSTRTVNLRVIVVCQFHLWGHINNAFSSPLGTFLLKARSNARTYPTINGYSKAGPTSARFLVRSPQKIPLILTRDELRELFMAAPQPFSMMFRWAVSTGLRRMELCQLQIDDVPPSIGGDDEKLREMVITRKGGRRITVYLPNALVDATWWYISTERPKTDANCRNVFLIQTGRPVRREYLSTSFKQFCAAIKPEATFHHLRHTYAVVLLTLLQRRERQGDSINPLKTLQVLMGHGSIASTEIYLRALDIRSEAVEEALDYLYGGDQWLQK